MKYVPTETIALYVAIQGALGDVAVPAAGTSTDVSFTNRWIWLGVMVVVTILLTTGLSYRSQKNASPETSFKFPVFEVAAATVAFLVWALSLPGTPLRDFAGYDYTAWSSVIILAGTVAVATAAHVFGKTVEWHKVVHDI